jgi:glycerol-3-phosphate dehydrogenase
MYDVVIIGCGIVGAATAYELSKYEISVAVLEKENDVAVATTKANSAIIHAGYDPQPGTLMARLNVEGAKMAKNLCETLDVPHEQCGALVIAFTPEEVTVLESLLTNGKINGVSGLRIIQKKEVRMLEPNLSSDVIAALNVPSTFIVSPWEYGLALIETAIKNGAELYRECEVKSIKKINDSYKIETNEKEFHTKYVINAAGLYADKVNNMAAGESFKITPDRGEYFLLDKSEGARVGRVIFQTPSSLGKGVLVAPTVHGNLIVGPNSVKISDCDDLSTTAEGLEFVRKLAQKSVPDIDFRANIRNFAGNRAKSVRGNKKRDFIIEESKSAKGFINLAGISSPGLSAAPAIAKMAAELLQSSGAVLHEKKNFNTKRKRVSFNKLSQNEKMKLIAGDSAYATVICRCENVTEGEIRDALNSLVPPKSVDAVKRRCGAGMGRCQGGFCGPRVVEILATHYNCSPLEILQDGAGTQILTTETKNGGCGCGK